MITPTLTALLLAGALQQAPAQVTVAPARSEIQVGETLQLTLRVRDGMDRARDAGVVRWLSATPELATVSADGVVTALNPGTARITGVAGDASAAATILIRPLPVASLEARLPRSAPLAGQALMLQVTALNARGEVVPDPELRFGSADPAVAGIDAGGLVFARRAGTTTLSVATGDGSVSTTTPITVRDAGPLRFRITPEEARVRTGDVVRLRALTLAEQQVAPGWVGWSVSGRGASVEREGDEGVFVAEAPGTYRVTARMGENAVESAIIRVEPREYEAELVGVGRGPIADHHSGDVWVFEGVDGRDYAYIGTFMYDWMKVWDVTNPSAPVLTDSLQLDARRINDVKIHPNGRLGIVTREGASNRRNGMVLLDLTTPANPTILSEYTETLTGGVHNVWIDGDNELVYAVHNGTRAVHIIDISDPRAPTEVGRWGVDNEQRSLHDVIVQDGYAYVSYWDDGLVTLDVGAGTHGGTPTAPAFVHQFTYPIGNTHVAFRHGDYLFVGDEIFPAGWDPDKPIEARGYIHVLDVSDMDNPVEVARYEVPEAGVHNFWAVGDRLYVGYYQAGLRVLDISGELRGDLYRQGREVAVLKTTDGDTTVPNWPMTWGAQIYKGKIYTSDLNSGLWIAELREGPRIIS